MKEAMSLKAKIRNLAKEKNVTAQVILQNYIFERFLARLAKSEYRDNFVIKGGMLIAAIVGIHNRSTMDLDATVKNYPLNVESLTRVITDICVIEINDGFKFNFLDIEEIRDDDLYGGYRIRLDADYDGINTPLFIDITTGDAITPQEVFHLFKMIFTDDEIGLWAYNIETILAEKVETVLRRGEANTRARDFYDIFILCQRENIDKDLFQRALARTSENRASQANLDKRESIIDSIEKSKGLAERWNKYANNYPYAKEITFSDTIDALRQLFE